MRFVLDAGALIAIERADRRTAGLLAMGRRIAAELVATAPVVAQVWRDPARQARLSRLLAMVDVRSADLADARTAGELLATTGGSDVVDALVAVLSQSGDQILTSDPDDLTTLVEARGIPAVVVRV